MPLTINRPLCLPPGTRVAARPNIPDFLLKSLGEARALKLLQYCICGEDGTLRDQYYFSNTPPLPTPFTYPTNGQRIPPLLVVPAQELDRYLTFYPVITGQNPRKLSYLSRFLLAVKENGKMVFISDDHTHALYGWALAKELGITQAGATLLHIDQHPDNLVPYGVMDIIRSHGSSAITLQKIAEWCRTRLKINEMIAVAEALFFDPQQTCYFLTDNLSRHTAGRFLDTAERDNPKMLFSSADLPALKQARPSLVTDIDLDFFAYAFVPLFADWASARQLQKDCPPQTILPLIYEAARQAHFVTIATSPEFFRAPEGIIRRLIKEIVAAA